MIDLLETKVPPLPATNHLYTIRLDPKTFKLFGKLAKKYGIKKADVFRRLVHGIANQLGM